MAFSRSNEYEHVVGQKQNGVDEDEFWKNFAKRHAQAASSNITSKMSMMMNNKTAVESMVEDLAKRTGLSSYLNEIRADVVNQVNKIAQAKEPESFYDIKEIQEMIEGVKGDFHQIPPILNKVTRWINENRSTLPKQLQSLDVMNDNKLIKAIDQAIEKLLLAKKNMRLAILHEKNNNN